jgi:hypothetical protein
MVEIAVKSLGTCAFSTKTGESLNSTLLRCGEKRGFVKAETLTEATNVAAGTCTEATNTITLLDRMTGWNAVMASTCNNGVTAVKITAKLGTDLSTN